MNKRSAEFDCPTLSKNLPVTDEIVLERKEEKENVKDNVAFSFPFFDKYSKIFNHQKD